MNRENSAPYPSLGTCWAVWTLAALLSYTRHYLQHPAGGIWPEVLDWLGCFYPWVLLSPLAFRIEHRFPIGRKSWPRNFAALLGASLAFSVVGTELALVFIAIIHRLVRSKAWWPDPLHLPFGEIALMFSLFWVVALVSAMMRRLFQLREREREVARLALEKAQLESSLRQAELEALRMRLNPHFLFNSLQNISVLAEREPRTASRMLVRLGDLLRAAFRKDCQPEVPLETEIALTRAYLDIEKMRFGDRLTVIFNIAPETSGALVPALLLQPLAENAIKHGLGEGAGTIEIQSELREDRLVLTVVDDGAGTPAESIENLEVGVGLGSTSERLVRMYGADHELSFRTPAGGGTEVRVSLPLRLARGAERIPSAQLARVDR